MPHTPHLLCAIAAFSVGMQRANAITDSVSTLLCLEGSELPLQILVALLQHSYLLLQGSSVCLVLRTALLSSMHMSKVNVDEF